MNSSLYEKLIQTAIDASKNSYSPYSEFKVGAGVLCGDKIYKGCNVENSSYGATNCAERTAIFSAIADGRKSIDAIAIVALNAENEFILTPPCGICRQVISEFSNSDTKVVLAADIKNYKVYSISELLPMAFGGQINDNV